MEQIVIERMGLIKEMKSITKVSVIVPMYNAALYIDRCLMSIINQTYKNLEIVLINDGSNDNTFELVSGHLSYDNRIVLINQNNKGVSYSRNIGIQNATGDYILFIDADDWIEYDMVENLVSVMEENIGIVMCEYDNEVKTTRKKNVVVKEEIWNKDKQITEFLKHKRFKGMLWNKLIRKNLFNDITFDENVGYGEDAQVMWEILKKDFDIKVIGKTLYHHILHNQSISGKHFSKVKLSAIKVWEKIEIDTRTEKKYNDLAIESLLFFRAYTLFEMYKDNCFDNEFERSTICYFKTNQRIVFKSSNISFKTKLFVVSTMINRNISRKVIR